MKGVNDLVKIKCKNYPAAKHFRRIVLLQKENVSVKTNRFWTGIEKLSNP